MKNEIVELQDIPAEQKQANFEATLRQVLKVDKPELKRREQVDKERREQQRESKPTK